MRDKIDQANRKGLNEQSLIHSPKITPDPVASFLVDGGFWKADERSAAKVVLVGD